MHAVQDALAEPSQFCEMMVTGAIDDLADPVRRASCYPGPPAAANSGCTASVPGY